MEKKFGILVSTKWDTNNWQPVAVTHEGAEEETGSTSPFHTQFTNDMGSLHKTYLEQFALKMPTSDERKDVNVVFLQAPDPASGKEYIVGLYAFPHIAPERHTSAQEEKGYLEVNLKSSSSNVLQLENFVDTDMLTDKTLTAIKKPRGRKKYVYLNRGGVEKILDILTKENPDDKRLHSIKFKLLKSYM